MLAEIEVINLSKHAAAWITCMIEIIAKDLISNGSQTGMSVIHTHSESCIIIIVITHLQNYQHQHNCACPGMHRVHMLVALSKLGQFNCYHADNRED